MLVLAPPVPHLVIARPFIYAGSPFRRGLHRGIDVTARPGARVTAPCSGEVVWSGERGATLRCGRFRVTLIGPSISAAEGPVEQGAPLGRATGEPLHLGVRRAGDPFGYVDPAPLLRKPPPMVGPPASYQPLHVPPPDPGEKAEPGVEPLAPWPAWAGLALLLASVRAGRRRGRARSSPRTATSPAARSP